MLILRRMEDNRLDLGHTLNRMQENLMKGDLRAMNANGEGFDLPSR